MALVFPVAPQEGDFFTVSPGRQYQYTSGHWVLYTNNPQVNPTIPTTPLPPVFSDTPPPFTGVGSSTNPYWFDTANGKMMVKWNDGVKLQWVAV